MTKQSIFPIEERRAIVDELARLSEPCEINDIPKEYFSLDIGSRRNKNAVIIRKNRDSVSFYIEDLSLVEKVKAANFRVVLLDPKSGKNKYRIHSLTLSEIKAHEPLIIELLNHSFNVVNRRKSKRS